MSYIQHCFTCRPCYSFVAEYAGIEPRTIATFALTVRRSGALLVGWWLAGWLVGWLFVCLFVCLFRGLLVVVVDGLCAG